MNAFYATEEEDPLERKKIIWTGATFFAKTSMVSVKTKSCLTQLLHHLADVIDSLLSGNDVDAI